ncbi:MAG: hypothetical protein EXR52_02325 [Dehalococcoidia bacterium]|nr:hypothetical protein [Dehalococcoidia bacterium]
MSFLRRWFARKPATPRTELSLLVVDQQCLRALFDEHRSLSDDEVAAAVLVQRPELLAMEVQASLLKLRQHGLVDRDELARHRITKAARRLRDIIPERATSNIMYYG